MIGFVLKFLVSYKYPFFVCFLSIMCFSFIFFGSSTTIPQCLFNINGYIKVGVTFCHFLVMGFNFTKAIESHMVIN